MQYNSTALRTSRHQGWRSYIQRQSTTRCHLRYPTESLNIYIYFTQNTSTQHLFWVCTAVCSFRSTDIDTNALHYEWNNVCMYQGLQNDLLASQTSPPSLPILEFCKGK